MSTATACGPSRSSCRRRGSTDRLGAARCRDAAATMSRPRSLGSTTIARLDAVDGRRRGDARPGDHDAGTRPSEALAEAGLLDRMRAIRARALRRRGAASGRPCRDCRVPSDRTRGARVSITSRSSSENIRGMYSALSAPTPCSPVIDPPASMQYCRISPPTFGGELRLPGNLLVVADQRMQVAVAGMEHVADAQAAARLELADALEHLGQLRARHDAVLHVVVRRHAPHRRERALPPLPDPRAMFLVCATSTVVAPARRQIASTSRELLAHFRRPGRRARR